MSLLPKEHGAYGQLSFPLATALAVAGITATGVLTAVAAVAGFLAHEPLLVLTGQRGARAQREYRRRARLWLAVTAAVAAGTGSVAVGLTQPDDRWAFLFPLAPMVILAVALVRRREKSATGEAAAATAFSLVAIPICVAAGRPPDTAAAVGVAFACIFLVSTLSVRVVILRVRGGGNPRATRTTRLAVVAVATSSAVFLAVAGSVGLLPWTTLLAILPGLAAALTLALRPPAPTRLRTVGWVLVLVSFTAGVILFAGL